jgi:hypothetical protein
VTRTIERIGISALQGALIYSDGKWTWRDGTPAPEVESMTLQSLAPNFRVSAGHVEIPKRWRESRYWQGGLVDEDAARAIEMLLARRPSEMIYHEGAAERLDDPGLRQAGYRVPVAEWDAAMSFVVGAWWDKQHEDAILTRARALNVAALASAAGSSKSEAKKAAARANGRKGGRPRKAK